MTQDRSYRWELPYTIRRGQRFPTVRASFAYLRTTREFDGLVDSGAQRSACSIPIAREAGLDPSRFPIFPIQGAGGVTPARLCPIDINILGQRIATEILVLDVNVVVVLLGRHDVFRAFQFGFDERAEKLLIEPY